MKNQTINTGDNKLRISVLALLNNSEPLIKEKLENVGIGFELDNNQIVMTMNWDKYSLSVARHSGRKPIDTGYTCSQIEEMRKKHTDTYLSKLLKMSMSTYYRRINRMKSVPEEVKAITKF